MNFAQAETAARNHRPETGSMINKEFIGKWHGQDVFPFTLSGEYVPRIAQDYLKGERSLCHGSLFQCYQNAMTAQTDLIDHNIVLL